MTPFPWNETMQFGFGVLRLSSKDFWLMTPREIFAAYLAFQPNKATPISRARLDNLMQNFPD